MPVWCCAVPPPCWPAYRKSCAVDDLRHGVLLNVRSISRSSAQSKSAVQCFANAAALRCRESGTRPVSSTSLPLSKRPSAIARCQFARLLNPASVRRRVGRTLMTEHYRLGPSRKSAGHSRRFGSHRTPQAAARRPGCSASRLRPAESRMGSISGVSRMIPDVFTPIAEGTGLSRAACGQPLGVRLALVRGQNALRAELARGASSAAARAAGLPSTSDAGRFSVAGFEVFSRPTSSLRWPRSPDPSLSRPRSAPILSPHGRVWTADARVVQDRRAMPLVSGFGQVSLRAETLVQQARSAVWNVAHP